MHMKNGKWTVSGRMVVAVGGTLCFLVDHRRAIDRGASSLNIHNGCATNGSGTVNVVVANKASGGSLITKADLQKQ